MEFLLIQFLYYLIEEPLLLFYNNGAHNKVDHGRYELAISKVDHTQVYCG